MTPDGPILEENGVCPSMCSPNPCFNDSPCTDNKDERSFTCTCVPPWIGELCNGLPVNSEEESVDAAIIVGIVVAVLILLSEFY